jgi:3-oxoacyl-[acyl-carrier protein] reductase
MIIVTGASKGIGYAVTQRLIDKGTDVLGLARDVSQLKFNSLSCDVSSYDEIKSIVRFLKKNKILVEGLVNAAGVASMNLAVTTPPQITQRLIQVNLVGTIYCCQLFSPLMLRKKKGSIINFSTIAVSLGLKGESIYVASKAGIEGFSRVFAREMADFNVRVNCIAPGPIDTDLIKGVSDQQISNIIEQQVIKKQFKPSDVCDLIELLLDEKSSSLSGQVLKVGGS